MKRKPFILIEVMLAFALIGLCFLPLFYNPSAYLKEELLLIEKMELQRISDLAFASFLEDLYAGKVPLKAFESKKNSPFLFSEREFRIPWILESKSDAHGPLCQEKIWIWTKDIRALDNGEKYVGAAVRLNYLMDGKKLQFTHYITARIK